MFKLNRKIEYAIIALKHMQSKAPGKLTTAKEISDLYKCPFDATSRVMQIMASRDVLKSEQGAHGGYQIVRDLQKVSLFDLIEMILGPVGVVKCMYKEDSACEQKGSCIIRSPVQILYSRLMGFYESISVMEMLGEPKPRRSELEHY